MARGRLTLDSHYKHGKRYFYGYGVPKDFAQARELYTKAAELGYEPAKRALEKLPKE